MERPEEERTAIPPLDVFENDGEFLLVADLPGVGVQTVLSPSRATPGAATLTIAAQDQPLSGFATLDNRGSRFVGPLQSGIGGHGDI